MNQYAKKAIEKIDSNLPLNQYEYSELMKCALYGGPDGQVACDAIAKAVYSHRTWYQCDPFENIRYRDKNETYFANKGRRPLW